MAQRRYWNFLDDDKTFDMNWRELSFSPAGRYGGFDYGTPTGMTLQLVHSGTGMQKVQLNLVLSPFIGTWKTKQGVAVCEDEAIELPISVGHTLYPRIDLIIGEHNYLEIDGGTTAIYKVVQGTPAAQPVAPALPDPNKQVILGRLLVPANLTDLNASPGATYTPEPVPSFANDPTIMRTHLIQRSTAMKTFVDQKGEFVTATVNTGTQELTSAVSSNFMRIVAGSVPAFSIISRCNMPITGNGHWVVVFTEVDLILRTSGASNSITVNGGQRVVRAGSCFTLIEMGSIFGGTPTNGKWLLELGGEFVDSVVKKTDTAIIGNKVTLTAPVGGHLIWPEDGSSSNYAIVNLPANYSIMSLQSFQKFVPYQNMPGTSGTVIHLEVHTTTGNYIQHNSGTGVPADNKPFSRFSQQQDDIALPNNWKLIFTYVELEGFWWLLGVVGGTDDANAQTTMMDAWEQFILLSALKLDDLSDVSMVTANLEDMILAYKTSAGPGQNTYTNQLFADVNNRTLHKMSNRIERAAYVHPLQTASIMMVGLSGGGYAWLFPDRVNHVEFNAAAPDSGSIPVIRAFSDFCQIGTEITVAFSSLYSYISFQLNATGLPPGFLPFMMHSSMADQGSYSGTYTPAYSKRSIRFIRRQNHWEIYDWELDMQRKANAIGAPLMLTLVNGFSAGSSGDVTEYMPPVARLDGDGYCNVDGTLFIPSVVGNTLICTLPAAPVNYRPTVKKRFLLAPHNSLSTNIYHIEVAPSGEVRYIGGSGTNQYMDFNMRWRVVN